MGFSVRFREIFARLGPIAREVSIGIADAAASGL